MNCPHCGRPVLPDQHFCASCGVPLSGAVPPSRFRRLAAAIGKCVCYLLLFFGMQLAVTGCYTASETARLLLENGYPAGVWDEALLQSLLQQVAEAVLAQTVTLTLISGILTVLFLALFFAIRHKSLFTEAVIRPVSFPTLLWCILAGAALNVFISVTISLLPLPQSWIDSFSTQYGAMSSGNLLVDLLAIAGITGFLEEVLYRGLIVTRLGRAMPPLAAGIFSALLFGFCHGTPIAIGYATLLGFLFWAIDRRCGSTLPSIVCHISFNAMSFFLFAPDSLFLVGLYLVSIGVLVLAMFQIFSRRGAAEDADTEPASPVIGVFPGTGDTNAAHTDAPPVNDGTIAGKDAPPSGQETAQTLPAEDPVPQKETESDGDRPLPPGES